jgi:hypothetical protein
MDRKQFLGTLLVLPVGVFLVHCSSDSSPTTNTVGTAGSDPDAPAAAPTRSGTMVVYTSSTNSAHHHTFMLDDSQIATPPAEGVSGNSSNDDAHTHTVEISAADLADIAEGETVQVTSGSASSHTHVFTFEKIA